MVDESRLILALDVFDESRAMDIARESESRVRAIKINWPLVMASGIGIVRKLSKYADVLCDLKVADIPNTNRLITEKTAENGAWGIIAHIFTGEDSLKCVMDSAGTMKVVGVVAMSHPGAGEYMLRFRDEFLAKARMTGLYGVIAPGNDYEVTRHIKSNAGKMKVITPGVGAQGGRISDAIRSGADYIIVGRSIYNAEDPAVEMDKINKEIKEAIQLKY